MVHVIPEKVICGRCGAQDNYENFQQRDRLGKRCLICGHEQSTTITTSSDMARDVSTIFQNAGNGNEQIF